MLVSCFPVSVGLYLDSGLFSVARGQVGLLSIRSEWPPGSKRSVSVSSGAVVTSSGAGGGGDTSARCQWVVAASDLWKEGIATWLILPVVICLSQRLSHACVSINSFVL
jgi:hypothetical protein